MHRWEDALFEQQRQLEFLKSEGGKRYMAGFEQSMRDRSESNSFDTLPLGIIYQTTYQTCMQADPIYVSSDVLDMIDYARESFEPEPVLPTDPFTACGFALFPRTLSLIDIQGKKTPIRAIGWLPLRARAEDGMEKGGLWLTYWSHKDDDANAEVNDYHTTPLDWSSLGPYASLTVVHAYFLTFNDRMWEDATETVYMDAGVRQWTLVQTMWRIGSQVIRRPQRAPRQARRDAKRHGIDREDITIVTLRRADEFIYGEGDGEPRDWKYRWIVRGHWRNQWYPSLQSHRQVWINSYVKGPDGKPLKMTQRVFEFVR